MLCYAQFQGHLAPNSRCRPSATQKPCVTLRVNARNAVNQTESAQKKELALVVTRWGDLV